MTETVALGSVSGGTATELTLKNKQAELKVAIVQGSQQITVFAQLVTKKYINALSTQYQDLLNQLFQFTQELADSQAKLVSCYLSCPLHTVQDHLAELGVKNSMSGLDVHEGAEKLNTVVQQLCVEFQPRFSLS